MEYASVSLLQIKVNGHQHQPEPSNNNNNNPSSYSRLPDLVMVRAGEQDNAAMAVSSQYYDLVSPLAIVTASNSTEGALLSTASTPRCEGAASSSTVESPSSHHSLTHAINNNNNSSSANSSRRSSSSTTKLHHHQHTIPPPASSSGKDIRIDDDVGPDFSKTQPTHKLRQTALIITMASFVIGTGCFPLSLAALILVCRRKGRADYKNALIIATMASVVGLAVNALVITYIIMKLERHKLQGL